jgi:integrase
MAEIQAFVKSPGGNLPTLRERAMLCVAYDAMTRRSELIAIDVEDLKFLEDGTGRLLIRRSKTDQAGEGHVAYLSRQTVGFVRAWLKAAGIKGGAVFRRIIGRGTVTYDKKGQGADWRTVEPGGCSPGVQGGRKVPQNATRRSGER